MKTVIFIFKKLQKKTPLFLVQKKVVKSKVRPNKLWVTEPWLLHTRFCQQFNLSSISDQFKDQDEPENWAMARYFPAQLCLQLQQKICENWINNRTELSSMFQSTGCCFTESSISSGWIFFGIRLLTWWHCLQFQRNWSIIDQLHLVANVRGEPHKAPTCIMAPNTPVWILSSL